MREDKEGGRGGREGEEREEGEWSRHAHGVSADVEGFTGTVANVVCTL